MKLQKNGLTIVSINYKKKYVNQFKSLSEKLILLGVNIVIGVSDYIGGIKQFGDNYIFYSLGLMEKDHIFLNFIIEKNKIKKIKINKVRIKKNRAILE